MPQLLVSGRTFDWSFVAGTADFRKLPRSGDPDEIDVLRISSPGTGFDVAIRVDVGQYSSGDRRYLGPLLVIGNEFPDGQRAVPVGFMIELRPKLVMLSADEPNAATVERIIQWCVSTRFKPMRVNSSGGRWVGYGAEGAASLSPKC
ncbi:hypothetical protein [Variovorax gossypii]